MAEIIEVRLRRIEVPLNQPFVTHLQEVSKRESIIVEMIDCSGNVGLGECVAFSSPWYTEETVQTCWDTMSKWLIPIIMNKPFTHPEELYELFTSMKGNHMAKAALDMAAWDLFAKQKRTPLWRLLGGTKSKIEAGIVLTGAIKEMIEKAKEIEEAGYKRIKIKIDTATNPDSLKKLIDAFPNLLFFADGNGIFDRLGMDTIQKFDGIGLTLIEQPFGENAWEKHRIATEKMITPIALDESLRSVSDVERMILQQAGSIIVLKPGRVGGITDSLKILNLAGEHNIPVWIGGMIEFGISKAHNLALASCSQVSMPGDFSSSTDFWEEDIVSPALHLQNGKMELSEAIGLGVELADEVIDKYCVDTSVIKV